ncbi:cache domain-containing protein [Thiomicrorhabdus sediminis]|nr:cache domain-containing protein [Thiomicrorhabdus sediminis]
MDAFSYDVLFLASLAENHFMPIEQKFDLPFITDIMANYLVSSPLVDQVRLLSSNGMELIRINESKGQAEIVAQTRLQDKANRYYFTDVKGLTSGSISVSYLDLNVENGQVEVPVKPMIRLASPLHDSSGNFIGAVIINFKAKTMISRLAAFGDETHDVWLVDDKGDWLLAPKDQMPWAGQLELGGNNLKTYLPKLYALLSDTRMGSKQAKQPTGFYRLQKIAIKPNAMIDQPVISRADNIFLIVHTRLKYAGLAAVAHRVFSNPYSFVVYFIGLWAAFIYSYQSFRRQRLKRRNRFQKNIITAFFDSAPEAMLVFNAQGQVVYENFKLTELLSELSGSSESGLQLESAQLRKALWHDYRSNALPKEFIEVVCKDKRRYFRRKASWIGEDDEELLIGVVVSELTDMKQGGIDIHP